MSSTVQSLLSLAIDKLKLSGVPEPQRDARKLLACVLNIGVDRIALHLQETISHLEQQKFENAVLRRTKRVPVSYILGYRDFFEHRFAVTSDVLDPRPETEHLVLEALREDFVTVLDLGTGSGCILISLLAQKPNASGLGVDQSEAALAIAQVNARAIGVAERCEFRVSNWFSNVPAFQFDLIVANPPYIHPNLMGALSPEVLHEPKCALTDHLDGLNAYRKIAMSAEKFLKPGGRLIFEIGFDQGVAVTDVLSRYFFVDILVIQDFDQRDRLAYCRRNS